MLAQAAGSEVFRIAVPPTVTAGAATQVPLSIRVESSVPTPRNSFLRVRGLPPTVSLSQGYVTAPGAWSVPLNALANLQMIVPVGVVGRTESASA